MRDEELARCFDRADAFLASKSDESVGIREFDDLLRGRLEQYREGSKKLDRLRNELVKRYERAIATKGVSKTKGPRDHLSVHAFGSSVMGLGSRESDLDISIEGTYKGGPLLKTTKGNKAKVLRNLMYTRGRLIRFAKSPKDVIFAMGARIPVVKLVDKPTNIPCDVTVGNTEGVFKSPLVGAILNVDRRFVDLVVLVKLWGNANGIKKGYEGTLSSFAVTMLVITFLQWKGLLPPLKKIIPGAQEIVCNPNVSHEMLRYLPKYQLKVDEWVAESRGKASTDMSVAELLVDFFAFLALFVVKSRVLDEFSNEVVVACPYEGYVGTEAVKKHPNSPLLRIEDPFNPSENCARTVSVPGLRKILGVLEGVVLQIQTLARQGGDWAPLDRMLFSGVKGKGKSMNWPKLGTNKNKDSLTGIIEELLIDGVRRRGQMECALGTGWLTSNFFQLFNDILRAEGVNFFQGVNKKILLLEDKVGSRGVGEKVVQAMLEASDRPDVVGDKLRQLAYVGRFPTQFRVHYLRETTLDSLISFARSSGFECGITPGGRLRFDGLESGNSVQGAVASEVLNEALLEDMFTYFLKAFLALPEGEVIVLDLERYLVPGPWVHRMAVRISKKFAPVSVKQPDSSKELYRVRKIGDGGDSQEQEQSDRVPVAYLGGGGAFPGWSESRRGAFHRRDGRNSNSSRMFRSGHQRLRKLRGSYFGTSNGRVNSTNAIRAVRLMSRLSSGPVGRFSLR
ncbi:hypothetical protein BSKO_12316 [Bryopsis sp. KO-2023]|nr:hypothetical protein BSKO_12316 [Bryopsis sp. KO-2023]